MKKWTSVNIYDPMESKHPLSSQASCVRLLYKHVTTLIYFNKMSEV